MVRATATGNKLNAVAFRGTGYVDDWWSPNDADFGAGAAILLTLSYDSGAPVR